jgi:hypothetical protein
VKARILIFTIIVLGFSRPAQAGVVESADSAHDYKKEIVAEWNHLKEKAEEAVNGWMAALSHKMDELKGDKPTETPARAIANENQAPTQPVVQAPVAAAPVASALAVAPVATSAQHEAFSQIIDGAKTAITGKEAVTVSSPGREASADLPKTKAGVPTFALTKQEKKGKKKIDIVIKDIPRLDIGVERSILKTDFTLMDKKIALDMPAKPKALSTPELTDAKTILNYTKQPVAVVAKAEPPKRGDFQLGQIVTQKKIEEVSLAMGETRPLSELKPFKEPSEDDLTLLAAAMLYKKKTKCHLVSGLLTDLANKPAYAEESNYYLGMCAHKMGFTSEAISRLTKVVKAEVPEYAKEALASLVEDLPREHDAEIAELIKGLKNRDLVTDDSRDNVYFVLSRAAGDHESWAEAASYAEKVSEKNKNYFEARYYLAVDQFGEKKLTEAEKTMTDLRDSMKRKGKSDKNMEALIAVNLARVYFMEDKYQAALDEYMKVPKDHPLWVQALIEQGWAQLSLDDPAGAIGNMYSLHSPYFRSIFMPESWVVRTIGYIDICQYGDAYRTLTRMEQLHSIFDSKVVAYLDAHKDPLQYYETVKAYIKGKSDSEVDKLPSQIIREIARQRGFLNVQTALNNLEDESGQYAFIYNMVKADQNDISVKLKRTRDRLAKTKFDLANIKKHPEQMTLFNQWNAQKRTDEQLVTSYQYLSSLYERARIGYLAMKAQALARLDKQKGKLKVEAGQQLAAHLKDVKARLTAISEGNEFLRYEIFAGSGENIRYQVAGGSTSETRRIPANVKPQKILNWQYDGEIWEDEIGAYRSALKNNCPNSKKVVLEGAAKTASRDK